MTGQDDATRSAPDAPQKIPEGLFDSLGISSPKRILLFIGCLSAALAATMYWPGLDELQPAPRRALFILLFATSLWVTGAIAAFAVGILVIALNIALLGNPDEGVFAQTRKDWEQFVEILGHPLVWLFFGGFVLAAGMARTGLDRWIASRLLARLGDRPPAILGGIMIVTFTLSMFMSNTATTAMMVAMLAPLLAAIPSHDRFGSGLLLGTAVAANLGGMGSLIGTPPNAIAVGTLSEIPGATEITFLGWMMIGLPPALVLLLLSWFLITRFYPSDEDRLPMPDWEAGSEDPAAAVPRWQTIVVASTLLITVGLWMTAQWHGLPTAVVSFVPIVVFTTTGLLGANDIRGLNYDVLFLLAGGLALGQVVSGTGLSTWIVERLPVEGLGVAAIALLVSYITVLLSNFMSNTAAANIVIPLCVTMAVGAEARVAVPIALSASAAMCLPIATPPNALVFATNRCRSGDFIKMGLLIGGITPLLVVMWISILVKWTSLSST